MKKKYNLLIPIAGKGSRMLDGGYLFPKPLIMAGNRHVIDYAMDSIDYSECNIIFIVRKDHVCNWAIDKYLKGKYGEDVKVVETDTITGGAGDSCYLAKEYINNETPLIIFCPDIYFEPKFVPTDEVFENDGFILTFKANSVNYSYVQHDAAGKVIKTAEKVVISDNASVGVYCFKSGKQFINIMDTIQHEKESYICPMYNTIIAGGGTVKTQSVPILYVMGTPQEMNFFTKVIYPYMLPRGFILCCDHSGFDAKQMALNYLKDTNIPFYDVGCYSTDDSDYADYINEAIKLKTLYPGYLILGFCRSGQGVNICANKHNGIRSVIVDTGEKALLGIAHNAANFFAIPGGTATEESIQSIIHNLQDAKFQGGRHQNRLQKIEKVL